jgi:hypothetical protein
MSVSTAFPTVIQNIITALQNAASLTGVRIFDGAEIDFSWPGDAVAIGHDGSFGDVEMQVAQVTNTPFAFTDLHQEEGAISCSLWSQDGSGNLTARRVRAFALMSAVDTVIRQDPTFSGACLYSILTTNAVSYRQTEFGAAVVIDFSISYQAQS